MGDLISRSELIKRIKGFTNISSEYFENPELLLDVIEKQPTAYDVEKVVAELVEMRNKDSQGCKDVGNKCLSYTDCGLCIMDRAIDIVKRGGAE